MNLEFAQLTVRFMQRPEHKGHYSILSSYSILLPSLLSQNSAEKKNKPHEMTGGGQVEIRAEYFPHTDPRCTH